MTNTKLTDFPAKTLSNISWLIMKRVKRIQNRAHFLNESENAELDRLLPFNCQVLEAFTEVRAQEKVANQ
jgi:hypothetical protein